MKRIIISGDHAGFELRQFLYNKLTELGYEISDIGPKTLDPMDNYPNEVQKAVTNYFSDNSDTLGIVICRNGVGVCVVANKYKGIRCALSMCPEHAASARKDDDANFLALGADYISKEMALQTCISFINTSFSKEERHEKRLAQYADLGSSYDNTGNL